MLMKQKKGDLSHGSRNCTLIDQGLHHVGTSSVRRSITGEVNDSTLEVVGVGLWRGRSGQSDLIIET